MSLPEPLAPFSVPAAARREGLSVFVRGLEVQAGIGVHAHEQGVLQCLMLDVTLELGARPVDRLADTVNYETVAEAAAKLVAEGHIGLEDDHLIGGPTGGRAGDRARERQASRLDAVG